MRVRPLPTKAAAAVTACVIGITLASAATADPPVQALTPEEFAERYDCVFPYPRDQYTPGLDDRLDRPRRWKTAVYALPGDRTGLITRRTNHATAAIIQARGSFRGACLEIGEGGVAWS